MGSRKKDKKIKYVQMKNENGKHVPITQRAQAIADYLETNHWHNNLNVGMPDDAPILVNNGADETPFTSEQLNAALKLSKHNKEPGPDGLQTELLKWLNSNNRQYLLNRVNSRWISRRAPTDLFLARAVPNFEGDTDNAANYRPISLLSSLYIYMLYDYDPSKNANPY